MPFELVPNPLTHFIVKVLVIEAGPFDRGEDNVIIPGAFPPVQYWTLDLLCQPQTELNNLSYPSLSGRVVGGGSTVNAMVFLRSASSIKLSIDIEIS
jgi:choline dehydrogenase